MNKIQIKGTFLSYSIVELDAKESLFLQNIMEQELINYNSIFFDLKAFKKLAHEAEKVKKEIKEVSRLIIGSIN